MVPWEHRIRRTVARLRRRHSWLDHALRAVGHYGSVGGNAQAGAVTFFGFLSFFPILALAFFVVGLVAQVYPDLRGDVHRTIDQLMPHVIGNGRGEIPMRTFEQAAGTLGAFGVLGVLYSGLAWISGMREALEVMFVVPRRAHPNLLVGKVRDLGTLLVVGLVLLVSVTLSAAVAGFSSAILRWVGVDPGGLVPQAMLWLVVHLLAVVATTVLLMAMFQLLVETTLPRRSLVEGALLGAVGFELLKMLANFLLGLTRDQPAFQALGVALIVVVWIHYFSRLVMLSAAYAFTSPPAVQRRVAEATRAPGAALTEVEAERTAGKGGGQGPAGTLGRTAVGAVLAGAVLHRRRKD